MFRWFVELFRGRNNKVRFTRTLSRTNRSGIKLFYSDKDVTCGYLEYGQLVDGVWCPTPDSRREFRRPLQFGNTEGNIGSIAHKYGSLPFDLKHIWIEVTFLDYEGYYHRLMIKIPIKVLVYDGPAELAKYS